VIGPHGRRWSKKKARNAASRRAQESVLYLSVATVVAAMGVVARFGTAAVRGAAVLVSALGALAAALAVRLIVPTRAAIIATARAARDVDANLETTATAV
jgi:hypothetical protein